MCTSHVKVEDSRRLRGGVAEGDGGRFDGEQGTSKLNPLVDLPKFLAKTNTAEGLQKLTETAGLTERYLKQYGPDVPHRWTQGDDPSHVRLPPAAYVSIQGKNRTLRVCRLITGTWQVGAWLTAEGLDIPQIPSEDVYDHMLSKIRLGFSSFESAPHYCDAERIIGKLRVDGVLTPTELRGATFVTRICPNPCEMRRESVYEMVELARARLRCRSIDLLQLHWDNWSYSSWRNTLGWLAAHPHVNALAVTNFDLGHLREVVEVEGIPLSAASVCLSVVDQRPVSTGLLAYCRSRGIAVLAYGVLLGGFISEAWLGQREPRPWELDNSSADRYLPYIQRWGGWRLFQRLLEALGAVAFKHRVTVPLVAMRWALQQEGVEAVIVGTRLGNPASDTTIENARLFEFALDQEDMEGIRAITQCGRDLRRRIGDIGEEYSKIDPVLGEPLASE
mmetsp:Transcript_542/g.1300  ORF Transcript_542/g.1300 Transcript_542/m.1300 type:complete len:448 (-) Transcript_542:142-1485(-)